MAARERWRRFMAAIGGKYIKKREGIEGRKKGRRKLS